MKRSYPSDLESTPHLIKIAADAKASVLPHVLRQWMEVSEGLVHENTSPQQCSPMCQSNIIQSTDVPQG